MQKFTKSHRLLNADDFSSVFNFCKVKNSTYFKIYYKANTLANSRLGLIVSKKINKKANKRNYMKRVIREIFRTNQSLWNNYDIIVRANKTFINKDFKIVKDSFLLIANKHFRIYEDSINQANQTLSNCNKSIAT